MGRDQHRHALCLEFPDEFQHLADQLRVEGAGHLVEQEGTGVRGEGTDQGDPLLLAAGEPVGLLPLAVSKSFGELEVLKGVDLTVGEHEAVALIGASGSGKSTLLRCVDLLEEIDGGDVLIDGEVITDPSVDPVAVRKQLGFVFQAFNLFPHLDVLENITLGAVRSGRMSKGEAEDRARELLDRFGLGGRERDKPDRLSGGQQQRVALIRAFAPNPRALLLDEVTSALDPELVGEVLELVRELKAEGMTMLIATHEMGFAREVADRVAFLEDGRLLEVGPAEAVIDSPSEPETRRFLGRLHQGGLT